MRTLCAGLALVTLVGCSSTADWMRGELSHAGKPSSQSCAAGLSQEQELALNLAEDVAKEGKRHAALAHFEALPEAVPQVRLNKAKVLRQLNQPGSHELYQSLLKSCLAAFGYQGLGQLAFAEGQTEQAYRHLFQAVRLAPTDASMRNDYALALWALGERSKAHFEFATALELAPQQKRIAINLVSLLLLEDRWDKAAALSAEAGLDAGDMRVAQQQAEQYRTLPERAATPPPAAPAPKASTITQADISRVLHATKESP